MTTILLADDHTIVRQGLRFLLEARTGFQVLGEASDGAEAIQLVEQLHPDVLIADIMMPKMSGLEVARQVKSLSPNTRVIILSMYDTEAYVAEALQAGVSAFVLKKSTSSDLVQAVHQVLDGQLYLSPPLNESDVQAFIERSHETPQDPYETLTVREREILHLAAEGMKSADIAVRLSISPRTVEMHRANFMHKLHLKTHTDLVRFAVQHGIVQIER
ncbi:MAG TPA: response regulator transcription factor [Anaerolineaceae bacterium]|jgi:DNA-binding NarL/FixJ family response regulator